jgi:hypothetical protein
MEGGDFTGKFIKPTEAFAVQHFDQADLNRLAPEILIGIVVLAIIGLLVHFVVSTLPARRKKERK